MNNPIIVSLDADHDIAIKLAKSFSTEMCYLKLESQLFTSAGPLKSLEKIQY